MHTHKKRSSHLCFDDFLLTICDRDVHNKNEKLRDFLEARCEQKMCVWHNIFRDIFDKLIKINYGNKCIYRVETYASALKA